MHLKNEMVLMMQKQIKSDMISLELWSIGIEYNYQLPGGQSPRASYVMSSLQEKQSWSSITLTSSLLNPENWYV